MEKYFRAKQATDSNITHADCNQHASYCYQAYNYMLDCYGHKHTLRICNIIALSIATVVAGTCLNAMLYVQTLSCVHHKSVGGLPLLVAVRNRIITWLP